MSNAETFAHLGPAPYRLLGVDTRADRVARNAERAGAGQTYTTNMCGGTCDHCSTAIWNVYRFECADGTIFKVGSECADAVTASNAKVNKAVKDAKKAHSRKLAAARAAKRREAQAAADGAAKLALVTLADDNEEVLSRLPHSKAWAAAKGLTLNDEVDWTLENAGGAGYRAMIEVLIERICAALVADGAVVR